MIEEGRELVRGGFGMGWDGRRRRRIVGGMRWGRDTGER